MCLMRYVRYVYIFETCMRMGLHCRYCRSATMQTGSYSVVGPTTWNGLPIDLRGTSQMVPVLNSTTLSNWLPSWHLSSPQGMQGLVL